METNRCVSDCDGMVKEGFFRLVNGTYSVAVILPIWCP